MMEKVGDLFKNNAAQILGKVKAMKDHAEDVGKFLQEDANHAVEEATKAVIEPLKDGINALKEVADKLPSVPGLDVIKDTAQKIGDGVKNIIHIREKMREEAWPAPNCWYDANGCKHYSDYLSYCPRGFFECQGSECCTPDLGT